MSLTVLEPGLFSLLVDHGRPGFRSLGVPVGGAADRAALTLGNALVGNPAHAPALELTLNGPTLRAEHSAACVVFGAPFGITVNRQPRPTGTTFTLEAGDVLKIGGTPTGARGYLCVAGGFQTPRVMASQSAWEPVKPGEILACQPSRIEGRSLPFLSSHAALPDRAIRVLAGPQRDWFEDDAFFTNAFEIAPASNRMGIRLRGPMLARRRGEMVSEAVAPGAVQVANDGLPIVLGVDGQTIGGYPKIAHVIRADLDRLAQLRPGQAVRFRQVTIEEAETAAQERAALLHEWEVRLMVTKL